MIETIKTFNTEKDVLEYAHLLVDSLNKYKDKNGHKVIRVMKSGNGSTSGAFVENENGEPYMVYILCTTSPYEDDSAYKLIFTCSSSKELNKMIKYLKTRPIADL